VFSEFRVRPSWVFRCQERPVRGEGSPSRIATFAAFSKPFAGHRALLNLAAEYAVFAGKS